MSARAILFAQFLAVLILALIHVFGNINYLYWEYRWLDIVTHFLGGLWVGLLVIWIGALRRKMPTLLFCAAAGLGLGMTWEFFEIGIGALEFPADNLDTVKDLLMDTMGATAASLFVARVPYPSIKR